MTETTNVAAVQDYTAAMHEIRSNLDVRRLMSVISNVMVPALAMGMTDCLSGSSYSPAIAWLPNSIIAVVGLVLAVGGALITCILARCHYGLVVNGTKMDRVVSGQTRLKPLNWLGVTTNFTALTALSAGGGLSLFCAGLGSAFAAWISGPILLVALMLYLRMTHWRANRLCASLQDRWQSADVPATLQEEHARLTQDATTADVSVIVTMGAALFAGVFNCMTNVGGIASELRLQPSVEVIRAYGVPVLAGFTLLSLLLSGRMVVRLRLALADSSKRLAELRHEDDDPYRFNWLERSFLLFLLLQLLTAASAVILVWTLAGATAGIIGGGAVFVAAIAWYAWCLRRARKRNV